MRRLLLAGSLLIAPPLLAQAGTTTWSLRGSLPDTVQAMAGLSEFEVFVTTATDGERLGMQMTVGPMMAASFPGMDLSSVRLQVVVDAAGDSVAVGLVLPPEISAQMGGAIGFRLAMAIPDSIALPGPAMNLDSLIHADEARQPKVTNTGRTATVAGLPCEIWTLEPPLDSLPVDSLAITMCLTEPPPAMSAVSDLMRDRLPDFGFDLDEMQEAGRKYFGGRDLVPLRVTIDMGAQQIVFQLESLSEASPDASFFALPAGLEPFPIEMLMGMMQSAMPQDDGET